MEKILIIHGPNLNMLGLRDEKHYGNKTLYEINNEIISKGVELGFNIEIFQSNIEGEIVNQIHSSINEFDGIIINPAAFTHYSIAIRDALEILSIPIIEVHLSNIYKREEFRHVSVTAPVATGVINGVGHFGYLLALQALRDML